MGLLWFFSFSFGSGSKNYGSQNRRQGCGSAFMFLMIRLQLLFSTRIRIHNPGRRYPKWLGLATLFVINLSRYIKCKTLLNICLTLDRHVVAKGLGVIALRLVEDLVLLGNPSYAC